MIPTERGEAGLDGRVHDAHLVEAGVTLAAHHQLLAVRALAAVVHEHGVDGVAISGPQLRALPVVVLHQLRPTLEEGSP